MSRLPKGSSPTTAPIEWGDMPGDVDVSVGDDTLDDTPVVIGDPSIISLNEIASLFPEDTPSQTDTLLGSPIGLSLSTDRDGIHTINPLDTLTDLTTMQTLLGYIARGLSYQSACGLTGIDTRTFYRWKKKGKDPSSPRQYHLFLAAVRRAEGEAELRAIGAWTDSFGRDWKAAQAFLARRFPERWGTAEQQIDIEGETSGESGLKVIISRRESIRIPDSDAEEVERETIEHTEHTEHTEVIIDTTAVVVDSTD